MPFLMVSLLNSDESEKQRADLADFGVQTLAHFNTAVRQQHGPVGVDMHQRARLAEKTTSFCTWM